MEQITYHKLLTQGKGVNRKQQDTFAWGSDRNNGLSSLKKGDLLTGQVTKVGGSVTFNIRGNEISAPREMFQDAVPGSSMLFEVLNITDSQIELGSAEKDATKNGKAFVAIMPLPADREVFLSRKKQAGKQAEREEDYQVTKNKINNILSKMTEQDYQNLSKEGFAVEDFTVSGLEAAVNRMKKTDSGAFKEKEQSGGQESKHAYTEKDIIEKLQEANLPASKDSVQKVMNALSLSGAITELDEDAMRYLIRTQQAPSIENLYKAQFSSNTTANGAPISEEAWQELLPQVEEVIKAVGFEMNEETLEQARWLVDNNLPLTEENLIYYNELSGNDVIPGQSEVLDRILKDLGNGIAPKDTLLMTGQQERMQRLVEKLDNIREDEIKEAVRTEKEINLKLLTDKNYREELLKEAQNKELTEQQQFEAVRAQRQLEEIRLKMTTEVTVALERRGFHIETQNLEKVVEELRELEDRYFRDLYKEADIAADAEQVATLKNTTQSLEMLKSVPSYVLGVTLSTRKLQTIPGLLEEGSRLAAKALRASEAYDSLMTEPNKEYGDSIQKAFQNSGSLLQEMGMEDTLYNRRALKILGYNRMEITEETMEQVKAYDLEVNNVMKNLHPAVTVRLIKEGINPLELPINELNQKLEELKQEQGITSEERFSTYLRKLDKEDQLSEDERKAYVGIYRLLHNIDKTDGAALGSVIKADREVTLNNLLTAVRSLRKGTVDARVDDGFGALQNISVDKENITDQLGKVFSDGGSMNQSANRQELTTAKEAQAEFLNSALKEMASEASPDRLMEVQENLLQTGLPTLQSEFAPLLSSGKGIWNTLKDVSVEKLFDLFQATGGEEQNDASLTAENLKQLRESYQNSDQAIRFLEDYKVPCTATNIMLAGQVLNNSNSFFKKYYRLRDENTDENSQNNLKDSEELTDTIIDKDSVNQTFEKLSKEAAEVLQRESLTDRIDSARLAELKSLGAQITLLNTLAKREFYQIPVETQNGVTTINLTVIRGSGASGKVAINLRSEKLGRVKADITLKDGMLNGYLACDSRKGMEFLKDNLSEWNTMLSDEKLTIKHLDICYERIANDNYSFQNQEGNATDAPRNPEQERLLYRIAKSLVLTVSKAEAAGTD
jgi:hypothetical protein